MSRKPLRFGAATRRPDRMACTKSPLTLRGLAAIAPSPVAHPTPASPLRDWHADCCGRPGYCLGTGASSGRYGGGEAIECGRRGERGSSPTRSGIRRASSPDRRSPRRRRASPPPGRCRRCRTGWPRRGRPQGAEVIAVAMRGAGCSPELTAAGSEQQTTRRKELRFTCGSRKGEGIHGRNRGCEQSLTRRRR